MVLKLTAIIVLLLCTVILSQKAGDEVFEYINLDYPGLEKVKKAYLNSDFLKAKEELLVYFQNRTNRKFADDEYPGNKSKADMNLENIFVIKSIKQDFGAKVDWTTIKGDKEWQFTLNKMKWFLNFVGVYQQSKDEKYVRAWMDQIESWISLGEPGYPRTIDSGRRLDNWVISYLMFVTDLKSPSITPEFNTRMLLSMVQQAESSYKPENWRRYSNWGTFENSGFARFVIMFPEFKENKKWLKEIYFRMDSQLANSFHSDGMHIEVSPSYHSHELSVWFNFLYHAKINQVENPWHTQIPLTPFKDLFYPRVNALMNMYKPTGYMPQVGDTDRRDERDLLRKMGEFWKWPELIYVATDGRKGIVPKGNSAAFPEGGYFIMRSGWGQNDLPFNEELYLLFDAGTNQPWHAHYDIFNIVATAYGHDLLVDPGRFTYNDSQERNYFKSTAAHNTVVIDGQDQPQKYTPPAAEWHSLAGFDYVIGRQNSNPGVQHERSVLFVKPEFWIVTDRLSGEGLHQYDQFWHLSEEALDNIETNHKTNEVSAPHLRIVSPGNNATLEIKTGYISHKYRTKIEAPVITYSMKNSGPVVWPTVLYPYKSVKPEIVVNRLDVNDEAGRNSSFNAVALEIIADQKVHYYLEQGTLDSIYTFADFKTNAKMLFVTLNSNNDILQFQMVDGTYFDYKNQLIAKISGIGADISVHDNQVEITSTCLEGFQIRMRNNPSFYLNGQQIAVSKKDEYTYYRVYHNTE